MSRSWLPEHPILPVHTTSRYGGTPDGSIPASMADIGDPLIALAMAAAATSTIKLGTSISLVPEHNPLMQAKQIATLDKFSGGRFLFGIGAGWLREETEIMGGDFDHRWGQTREAILAMKELWTKEEAEFHGRFFDFPPVKCSPKPVQQPHPPVLLGGYAANVFKRVVAWGDGWMPVRVTEEQVRAGRATMDELAEAAGRDPSTIQLIVTNVPTGSGSHRRIRRGRRQPGDGGPAAGRWRRGSERAGAPGGTGSVGMSSGGDLRPPENLPAWSLMRGKNDGERWSRNDAEVGELIAWADISDFEHYMGPMPFPYDNEAAVRLYEAAKSDASTHGITFSHQHYAGGFLEAVYEECRMRMGLGPPT